MLFSFAYLTAFLIAAGIMILTGLKKGYPLSSYLLILAGGVIFFIIGDKVFTWSPGEWINAITRLQFPETVEKNALGGIIGLFVGILLAQAVLRFNLPVFDHLAIALPMALAVSRLGCLMAGCCFGSPTTLPLGIKYAAGSQAWQSQLIQGLISDNDHCSLAVHPVQLYQFAGCLLIAFIAWRTRKFWKANGSLFLFSVLCYGFMRFFIEFLCDPLSNSVSIPVLWKMNLVQWLILISFIPGLTSLLIRETKTKIIQTMPGVVRFTGLRQMFMAAILCVILIRCRAWFDIVEYTTMLLFFIPTLALVTINLYRNHSVAGFRWVLPLVFICCISFMGQKSEKTGGGDDKVVFTDIGLIGSLGNYCENISTISKEWIKTDPCTPHFIGGGKSAKSVDYWSTTLQDNGYSNRNFWQSGIDVSRNWWKSKYRKVQFGARGFYGYESGEKTINDPLPTIVGVSPYVNFDWHYFGFGTGFSVGQMITPYETPVGHKDFTAMNSGDLVATNYYNSYILPSLSLRVGPSDIIYAEACFPGTFPSAIPFATFRAGVGSGLGKTNGTKAAVGYCNGLYAQFVYPIKNKIVVDAQYCDNLSGGEYERRFFTVGVHFRIFKRNGESVKVISNEKQ